MSKENSFDSILSSDELLYKPILIKDIGCDREKIYNILKLATKKAKEGKLKIVTVNGTFTKNEVEFMELVMKQKSYKMYKSETGYIFTPYHHERFIFENSSNPFGESGGLEFGNLGNPFGGGSGFNFGRNWCKYNPSNGKFI
jgi:hypothetical protein